VRKQTSLFLSSLSSSSAEQSIRTCVLHSLPGIQPMQLKSIVHVAKTRSVTIFDTSVQTGSCRIRCAFVNFRDRASAELAAQAWANGLEVDGEIVSVKWGRSRPKNVAASSSSAPAVGVSVPVS